MLHELKGSFLVFGDSRVGKTVLVERMLGSYSPCVGGKPPSSKKTAVRDVWGKEADETPESFDVIDVINGTAVPSSSAFCSEDSKTEVTFRLYEIDHFDGENPGRKDLLKKMCVEAEAGKVSEGGEGGGLPSTEIGPDGVPELRDVCGLIWVIRAACLSLRISSVKNMITERLAKAVEDGEIIFPRDDLSDSGSWEVPEEVFEGIKEELRNLYVREAKLYFAECKNQALGVSSLSCFLQVPVLFVLNQASGSDLESLDRETREVLFEVATKTSTFLESGVVFGPGTVRRRTEGCEEEGPWSMEVATRKLFAYAVSAKCTQESFIKTFKPAAFKGERSLFNPNVTWLPSERTRISSCVAPSLSEFPSFSRYLSEIARKPANKPALVLDCREREGSLERSISLLDSGVLDHFSGADEILACDTFFPLNATQGEGRPESSYSKLASYCREEKNVEDPRILLAPSQICFPPPTSFAAAYLGNERDSTEADYSLKKTKIYRYYRERGALAFEKPTEEGRCAAITLEGYLYRWMADATVWNYELSRCRANYL